MVALERGAKFWELDGFYYPWRSGVEHVKDNIIIREAEADVAEWLGFKSVSRYLKAFGLEKEKIFRRATY